MNKPTLHTIDYNMKKIAQNSARNRIGTEYDRFKVSYQERLTYLTIGCLGELLFTKILQVAGILFESSYDGGEIDNFDFLIAGQKFDAKTSYCDGTFEHLNLLYSKDQYAAGLRKNYDWVIQIFINGRDKKGNFSIDRCKDGMIAGAIKFSKIKDYPNDRAFYGDDYKVPISDLSHFKSIR